MLSSCLQFCESAVPVLTSCFDFESKAASETKNFQKFQQLQRLSLYGLY